MVRCSKATSGWLALLCLVASLWGSYASQEHDKCFLLRLKDRNIAAVAAAVEEIASIDSSKAGKWLTAEDVAELSGRSQAEVSQLKTFVESQSGRVEQVSPTRDMALACFPPHAQVLGGAGPPSPIPAANSSGPIAANSTMPVPANNSKPADAKDSRPVIANSSAPAAATTPKVQPVDRKSSAPAEVKKPTVVSNNTSTPAAADKPTVADSKSSAPAAATPTKAVGDNSSTPTAVNTPKVADSKSSAPTAAVADKPKVVSANTSAPAAATPAKAVESKSSEPAAVDKPKAVDSKSSAPAAADKPRVVENNPAVVGGNSSTPAAAKRSMLEIGISPLSAEASNARILAAIDPSPKAANNSRLVEATRNAVQAHAPSETLMGAAAEKLAAALPAALADITEVILPVSGLHTTMSSSSSKYTSGPIVRTPGLGAGAPGQSRSTQTLGAVVGGAGTYTAPITSAIGGIKVSSPYGVPLPQPIGYFAGYTDPTTKVSYAIPQFTTDTLLFALGASDAATILKSINEYPVLMMLPCSVVTDEKAELQGMVFATTAHETECAGQLNITWSETYADGRYTPGPRQSLTYNPQPIGTCGDAVRRSKGMLPNDTCAQIAAQYTDFAGVPSDISEETVLYWYGPLEAGVTTYVGLRDLDVSLTLSSGVQEPFRTFGRVHYASYSAAILAGTNTPAEWRAIYNVPHYANNAGAGLMVSPALFTPQADYSPYDLAAVSRALNVPVSDVASVANAPLFPANNPAAVYAAEDGGKSEAALSIQMITEYGTGSGAKFGFVASSSNSDQKSLGVLSNFLGYMGMRPLPDVLSLSWCSAQPATPGTEEIKEVIATDAILAKMAAMGVTVVAASGDYGSYGARTATCAAPFASQAPAGSPWVTSVGAVQQARTAPKATPQLVGAMSPLGTPLTSAGGFSWVAEAQTPNWQAQHVQRYIRSQQNLPSWPFAPQNAASTGTSFSVSCMAANSGSGGDNCVYGRGYPDVSLSGVFMPVQLAGVPAAISGTDASAPAFAGLVMHLNAAVRATPGLGHCKLGFLNPFLYWAAEHYPNAFTDITVGGTGFAPDGTPCTASFNAAPGWDAFTGLGVPNIQVLSKAAVEWASRQEGLWYNGRHYHSHDRRDAADRDAGTGPNRDRSSGPDYRASRGYDRDAGYGEQEDPDRSIDSPQRSVYDTDDYSGAHHRRRDCTGPNVRSEQDPDRRSGDSLDGQLDLGLGDDPHEQQQVWQDSEYGSQHGGYHGEDSSIGPYREAVREDSEEEGHDEFFDSSRYESYERRASEDDDADKHFEGGHHHGRRGHDDDQYEQRNQEDSRYTRQHHQHHRGHDSDEQHAHDGYSYGGSEGREDRDRSYTGPTQRDGQQRRYAPYDAETPVDDSTGSYDVHDRRGSDSRRHRYGYEVEYEDQEDRHGRRGDAYEGSKVDSDRYTLQSEPVMDRRQAGEKSLQGSADAEYPERSGPAHHGRYQHHDDHLSKEELRSAGRRDEGRQGHAGNGYTREEDRPGYPLNGHGDRRQRAEGSQE